MDKSNFTYMSLIFKIFFYFFIFFVSGLFEEFAITWVLRHFLEKMTKIHKIGKNSRKTSENGQKGSHTLHYFLEKH